ncbi:MAG: divergent polysaccharide deacetylase family protein [Hyphomicrobiales bacterium]|nr:divergent polysaccharide deacetylase family protein [Hyphomicrobiales bacterium]
MDDLHKPLGKPSNGPSRQQFVLPAILAAATCVLSLTAYLVIDARDDGTTTVAVKDAAPATPTSVTTSTSGAGTTTTISATPSPTGVDGNNNAGIDLTNVKPLSPIDPLPEEKVAVRETPSFKPVQTKKLSDWMPAPDLVEKSEFGSLPRISDGNVRPLDAYSRSSGVSGANRVAIVVGGLGLSQTGTQAAIRDLPSSISLGFSPFGNSLQRWMQNARREGHEVVLQLPMEPLGYPTINPGPRTLISGVEQGQNLMNLRWALGRMTNYPVVMNYLGAGFTSKPNALRPVLKEIRDRGLGYIDDGSASASEAIRLSQDLRLPHASGNIIVDSDRDKDRMRNNLKALESLAKARGYAIATASAFPESVEVIKEWAQDAEKRDIIIVPVSNLLKDYGR